MEIRNKKLALPVHLALPKWNSALQNGKSKWKSGASKWTSALHNASTLEKVLAHLKRCFEMEIRNENPALPVHLALPQWKSALQNGKSKWKSGASKWTSALQNADTLEKVLVH